MTGLKTRRFTSRTHRLINSRFPTVGVFDDIADSEEETRIAFQLEEMSNGRLRGMERLERLPAGSLAVGPTASLANAAFLHAAPAGGRFNGPDLGAWYCAAEIETAIEETLFHNDRRLRLSEGGFPNRIQLRQLIVDLDIDLPDLRGLKADRQDLYDPTDYSAGQAFAARLRWPYDPDGADGLIYDSVRRDGGINVCIFRPGALPLPVVQGAHYEYVWDAQGKVEVVMTTGVARHG